ncbi:GNAT family N-acetyltransferase [Marinilactibacillus kalidii]|uniref:GNAT family N-acetyltransferase n=1 Tax=Marinilactibacillus kalidii TaxID=2820274 RepID=UPI001ABDADD5|nr:GNAT family N-acetyltransferase [Marinilactibacillus kalidii]
MKQLKENQKNEGLTLVGERIYLRGFVAADAEAISSISNQPEVSQFLPDWKSSKEDRLNWIVNYEMPSNQAFLEAVSEKVDMEGHFLKMSILLKDTDELIGWCCTGMKGELPLPNREVMYAVSYPFQNKGYATEASTLLIDYLFNDTTIETLNAIALIHNSGSNQVIKKCGFEFKETIEIDGEIFNRYRLNN